MPKHTKNVFGGFDPQDGKQYDHSPQKAAQAWRDRTNNVKEVY